MRLQAILACGTLVSTNRKYIVISFCLRVLSAIPSTLLHILSYIVYHVVHHYFSCAHSVIARQ